MKFKLAGIMASLILAVTPGGVALATMHDNGSDNEHNNITICHATGSESHPYVSVTANANGIINGHVNHQHTNDIIPAFDYVSHGEMLHFAGQNTDSAHLAILENGCMVEGGQGGGGDHHHMNITLCHATGSSTNPYVEITVDSNSILHGEGHASHSGDIIPAFEGYAGKNLTEANLAILHNHCAQTGGQGGGGGQVLGETTTVSGGQGGAPASQAQQVALVPEGSVNGGEGAASKAISSASLVGLTGSILSMGSGLALLNRRQS